MTIKEAGHETETNETRYRRYASAVRTELLDARKNGRPTWASEAILAACLMYAEQECLRQVSLNNLPSDLTRADFDNLRASLLSKGYVVQPSDFSSDDGKLIPNSYGEPQFVTILSNGLRSGPIFFDRLEYVWEANQGRQQYKPVINSYGDLYTRELSR